MKTYTLLLPLVVDKVRRLPGDSVPLSDEQADWLDGIGVISKDGLKVAAVPAREAVRREVTRASAPRKWCCGPR